MNRYLLSNKMIYIILVGVIGLNMIMIALGMLSIYKSKLKHEEKISISTQSLVQILEEALDGEICRIDVSIKTIIEYIKIQKASGGIDGEKLNNFIHLHGKHHPQPIELGIADAEGIIRYGIDVPQNSVSIADREYFNRAVRQSEPQIIISNTVKSRITNKWSLVVGRKINNPDGSFDGFVYAVLPVEYLTQLFAKVNTDKSVLVGLRNLDTELLARYPLPKDPEIGYNQKSSPQLQELIKSGVRSATYRAFTPSTTGYNIESIFSFRKVGNKPLFIVVGHALDDYMGEWEKESIKTGAFLLVFLIGSAILFLVIYNLWKKQIASYAEIIKTNSQLELERTRYLHLMQNSTDGIHILDEDGNVVECNQVFADMLGYTLTEAHTLNVSDWDVELLTKEDGLIENMMRGNRTIHTLHKRKNGDVVDVQVMTKPIEFTGRIYLYASSRDITLEKRLQNEVLAERNFVSTIIDNANAIIAVIRLDGTMSRINSYGESFTGYSKEQIAKEPYFWTRFLRPEIRGKVAGIITKASMGEIVRSFQNAWISKDGEERMFEWSNTLVQKEDGTPDYIYTIGIDISDRVAAQLKIEEQREELKKTNNELILLSNTLAEQVKQEVALKLKAEHEKQKQEVLLVQRSKMADMGEMLGAILHQWKQPLNAISLITGMLDDIVDENGKIEKKDLADFQNQMHKQIANMTKTAQLFKNFFTPSKERVLFMACASIEETIEIFKPQIKTEDISINIKEHEHFYVYAYKNEFMQVVMNILANAKDILKEKNIENGKIDVSFESDDTAGIVRIKDNGGGIAEELLPDKIFEPYITTKGDKGTGIGLNIARTIIETHLDGKLWAHNLEAGAEFVIELPLAENPNQ